MKLLLLLLLAQQQVSIIPVTRGAVLQPDGGVTEVGAGTWFSEAEVMDMGRDHRALRAENENLKQHAPDVPYRWLVVVGGSGIVLGLVTGYFVARAVPR